jgi:hypothetical protein
MTEYVVLETDLPIFGFQPHSDHIRPCELQDAGQVLAMDLEICGEDRGSVLRKRMGSAYVFLAETLVQGIFFPDLGDGVIEAVTPRAGLELVRFKAMAAKSATVPRENTVAMEYLWDQGSWENPCGGGRTASTGCDPNVIRFVILLLLNSHNTPYSPRRGESAKQRARDRGGIGLLCIMCSVLRVPQSS